MGSRRTPQPTSSERPKSVEDPRGTFPLFVARVCPSYGEMPQTLACGMGMGESGDEKL